MISKSKQTPAVAYVRMSSDRQETSPAQQRQEILKLAKRDGYDVLREYADEGISGSEATGRPNFQRLIRDAQEKGDFRVILCWDQDRFSRFDPLEANHYWFLLRQAGVQIVTVRQGPLDFSTLGSWLTASVTQHGKNEYLRDLSANVLRARLVKAHKGKYTHNRPPYGYRLTPEGDVVLGDAGAVRTVRWIFKAYSERDISLWDIAHELNERGTPPVRNGKWTSSSVRGVLLRDSYATGRLTQFRFAKGKFHTIRGGNVVSNEGKGKASKPKDDWLTVPCPKILSGDVWQNAQHKMHERRRRTTPKPNGGRALLTGLLYCGHCGKRMHAAEIPRKRGGKPVRDLIYACSTYNENGKHACHRNPIHEVAVLEFLVGRIQETLLAPANAERLTAAVKRHSKVKESDAKGFAAELRQLRARRAKLDLEIKAAMAELRRTPDDLYADACQAVRELRDERAKVEIALESLQKPSIAMAADTDARIKKALTDLQQLSKRLTDVDPSVAREALARTCERIDLWFEHVEYKTITRSVFQRGVVTFRVAELCGRANRPG